MPVPAATAPAPESLSNFLRSMRAMVLSSRSLVDADFFLRMRTLDANLNPHKPLRSPHEAQRNAGSDPGLRACGAPSGLRIRETTHDPTQRFAPDHRGCRIGARAGACRAIGWSDPGD